MLGKKTDIEVNNLEINFSDNRVLKEVYDLLTTQTMKGLEKYGHSVNPDEFTTVEWIDHARQEIIDMLVYLTILKLKLQERNR